MIIGYKSQKDDLVFDPQMFDQPGQSPALPSDHARNNKLALKNPLLLQPREGLQQSLKILARLDGADKKNEWFHNAFIPHLFPGGRNFPMRQRIKEIRIHALVNVTSFALDRREIPMDIVLGAS